METWKILTAAAVGIAVFGISTVTLDVETVDTSTVLLIIVGGIAALVSYSVSMFLWNLRE